MILKGFCGGSYTAQSTLSDDEICMNWLPEPSQVGSQVSEASLYPTPGVVEIGNITSLGLTRS